MLTGLNAAWAGREASGLTRVRVKAVRGRRGDPRRGRGPARDGLAAAMGRQPPDQ